MDFVDFIQKLRVYGLSFLKLFYGPQRGLVTNNQDPERRGRIQAHVPGVGQRTAPAIWIDPLMPFSGVNYGAFHAPEVGSPVWVEFENGDPSRPLRYSGGWFAENAVPRELAPSTEADATPYRQGIVTKGGHVLSFNDMPGQERIQLLWHKPAASDAFRDTPNTASDRDSGDLAYLTFESSGNVNLSNSEGTMIVLDAENSQLLLADKNGNTVTLDKDGIKLLDKSGQFMGLDGGKMKFISAGSMLHYGASFNAKVGSALLGDGATLRAVLGEPLIAYLQSLVLWLTRLQLPVNGATAGPPLPADPPPLPSEELLATRVKLI